MKYLLRQSYINPKGRLVRLYDRGVAGLSGLGTETANAQIPFAPGAIIAPEFRTNTPGLYVMDITIEKVPVTEKTTDYLDPDRWTAAMRAKGVNATCRSVVPLGTRQNGTTGWLGQGEALADILIRATIYVDAQDPAAANLSGLGLAWGAAAIWAVVAVGFIIYLFTGHNVLVDAIRYIAEAAAEALKQASMGLVPVVLIGALAIFLLNKSGGSFKFKGFSSGKT